MTSIFTESLLMGSGEKLIQIYRIYFTYSTIPMIHAYCLKSGFLRTSQSIFPVHLPTMPIFN
jgi:hypothetical protein